LRPHRIGKDEDRIVSVPCPFILFSLIALLEWRAQSPYATDLDFLFTSVRFKGTQPLSPDSTSCALAFDPSFPWEEVERSCRGQALIQSAKCLSWREPFYFFFFSCLGAE